MSYIVERGRRICEELIERDGGIEGYFKHCQAMDRALAARSKAARRKRAAKPTRKPAKRR